MRFCFGEHVLDSSRRELRRGDGPVHVEPQVFDLLHHLILNHDRVVSRDELISTVWQGRIVSESTLDSRIAAARRAVGDSGERQCLIRTVVRKGVRFVGDVRTLSASRGDAPASEDAGNTRCVGATLVAEPVGGGGSAEAGSDHASLPAYRDVITAFVGAHRGQTLENLDERIVAVFPGPSEAVRAALEFQRELTARNALLPNAARVDFRVGIEAGDAAGAEDVASEWEAEAALALARASEPGGVCVSAKSHPGLPGEVRMADIGELEMPHDASARMRAYRIHDHAPTALGRQHPGHDKPTVAVLPFVNMSGDREQEYFSDGVTEDILTALSRYRSLWVIARSSAFMFKGHDSDSGRVGTSLGVEYVVEGSVRRVAERVRISARLVATDAGRCIWAERYDRGLEDMFAVQDRIAETIAARIEPEVASIERGRVERNLPRSMRAWDFYYLAMSHFYRWSVLDNREAERLFRCAIELDPRFAQAHAWLSYTIVLSMLYFDAAPDDERLAEARRIARQSVELDDRDALGHFMYGRALLASKAYDDALSELQVAVELNPGLAMAYCGLGDTLACGSRFDEAIPFFEKAIDLGAYDPQRWAFYAYRALAHLFARDFLRAAEWAQKATRIPNCHHWAFAHRAAALGYTGDAREQKNAVTELLARRSGFSCSLARERLFYVRNAAHLDTYIEGLRRAGLPE